MGYGDSIDRLKQYLAAGHGRGYRIIQESPETYRKLVEELCVSDSSFDLQCEGSRAVYVYDLTLLYDDPAYFLNKAIKEYMKEYVDSDWHTFYHLTDLLMLYAFESHEKKAEDIIWKKYEKLFGILMTKRFSGYLNEVSQNYERIAIALIGQYDWECAKRLMRDMGAWFIRRRTADPKELKWRFGWLFSVLKDEYGEEDLQNRLVNCSKESKEIAKFYQVMTMPDEKEEDTFLGKKIICNADDILKAIQGGERNRFHVRGFKLSDEDKLKLANAAVGEKDLSKKAQLIEIFTLPRTTWPISVRYLIDWYEESSTGTGYECIALRKAILEAMTYIEDEELYAFAKKDLGAEITSLRGSESRVGFEEQCKIESLLDILINHFHKEDEEMIFQLLETIQVDRENSTGWHGIVMDILKHAKNNLPDSLLLWVYENSLCSCCRRDAVEELMERGSFSEKYRQECQFDSDQDIRDLVQI